MSSTIKAIVALFAFVAVASAHAELSKVGSGGFTTSHVAQSGAGAEEAWRVLTAEVSQWWSGDHSWSGDASRLYIDAGPGGCFCERLPEGGWVEHLALVYLAPGQELRFRGALGPLMTLGLTGTMIWAIESTEEGARIRFTYIVSGYLPDGFEQLAPAVDGVVGEQLAGLVARLASD